MGRGVVGTHDALIREWSVVRTPRGFLEGLTFKIHRKDYSWCKKQVVGLYLGVGCYPGF